METKPSKGKKNKSNNEPVQTAEKQKQKKKFESNQRRLIYRGTVTRFTEDLSATM
jgi:hypothetical protein